VSDDDEGCLPRASACLVRLATAGLFTARQGGMTMQFRVYLRVDDFQELGRPRWEGDPSRDRRELHLTLGEDVHLVLREQAAMSLAGTLAAVTNIEDRHRGEGHGR